MTTIAGDKKSFGKLGDWKVKKNQKQCKGWQNHSLGVVLASVLKGEPVVRMATPKDDLVKGQIAIGCVQSPVAKALYSLGHQMVMTHNADIEVHRLLHLSPKYIPKADCHDYELSEHVLWQTIRGVESLFWLAVMYEMTAIGNPANDLFLCRGWEIAVLENPKKVRKLFGEGVAVNVFERVSAILRNGSGKVAAGELGAVQTGEKVITKISGHRLKALTALSSELFDKIHAAKSFDEAEALSCVREHLDRIIWALIWNIPAVAKSGAERIGVRDGWKVVSVPEVEIDGWALFVISGQGLM